MGVLRDKTECGHILAIILLAVMILGGCATTSKYSYDPRADFSTLKSYNWASVPLTATPEPLIEKNVRYYADQSLKNKGFTLTSDKPDFVISMSYESDYDSPYKMKKLYLFFHRAQGKDLVWQGWAKGGITADAASPKLGEAVKKILSNFPPKR
jgi:hypothetical protein